MSEPPENPVFFTDRDLGKSFPSILKQAQIPIEIHSNHFSDNTKDEEWLTAIGEKRWFVLTRDKRIRYRSIELTAVKNSGIGMFVLVGNATHSELAQNFIATHKKIIRFIQDTPLPFIAKIRRPSPGLIKAHRKPVPGSVEKWWP